jgi:hypothetical protein
MPPLWLEIGLVFHWSCIISDRSKYSGDNIVSTKKLGRKVTWLDHVALVAVLWLVVALIRIVIYIVTLLQGRVATILPFSGELFLLGVFSFACLTFIFRGLRSRELKDHYSEGTPTHGLPMGA